MNAQEQENRFIENVRAEFSASVQRLDGDVLARLRLIREQAQAAAGRRPAVRIVRQWALPAGALAALFVVVVGGVLWWGAPTDSGSVPFVSSSNEDIPLVLTSDNLDMYADLDFYQWLATQDQQSQGTNDDGDNNNG